MEGWFKALFATLAVLYVLSWIFTIRIAQVQMARGDMIILPVVAQDSQEYAILSDSLIQGRGFTLDTAPETYRVPGYPTFVTILRSVAGGSFFAVTLVQILLVFGAALIIRRIGTAYATSTVGGIAALLFLFNPVVLVLALTIMTDTLFLFLFVLGFYAASVLFEKRPILAVSIASLVFSACLYIRAMGLFALPIFLAPFLIATASWKNKFIAMSIVALVMISSLLPWMQRNYVQSGVFSFTSFTAVNLAQYSVPMFWSWQQGTSVQTEIDRLATAMNLPFESWRDIRHSKEINQFTIHALLAHPFEYLFYHMTLSFPFLFSSSVEYASLSYEGALHLPVEKKLGGINLLVRGDIAGFVTAMTAEWWKFAERVIWLLLYGFALVGLVIQRRKVATWVFVFTIAYLMLLAGPAANARYAIQAQPCIFILSACGILYALQVLLTRKNTVSPTTL